MPNRRQFSQKLSHKVFFFLNMVDSWIFTKILSIFAQKTKKVFIMGFILTSIAMIVAHVGVFLHYKNENLFEILQVDRITTEQQLDEQYDFMKKSLETQKIRERDPYKIQQIQEDLQIMKAVHSVLKNPIRRKVYDKYLEVSEEVNINFLSPENTITHIIQAGSVYMIMMLGVLINSEKQQMKKSIKWVVMTLIIFILIEVDMIIGDTDKKDFFDIFLPRVTVAERGEILKIIIVPIMLIIRNFFQHFFINTEDKVLKNLSDLTFMQKGLKEHLRVAIEQESNPEKKAELTEIYKEMIEKLNKREQEIAEVNINFAKIYEKNIQIKENIRRINLAYDQAQAQQKEQKIQQQKEEKKTQKTPKQSEKQKKSEEGQEQQQQEEGEIKLEDIQSDISSQQQQSVDGSQVPQKKKKDSSNSIVFVLLLIILFQEDIKKYLGME